MAAVSTTNFAAVLPRAGLVSKNLTQSSPVYGLPALATRGHVRCTLEERTQVSSSSKTSNASILASVMATAAAAVSTTTGQAMALVDERMSTEGTGLPFGLSNNLLTWILLGVFGLIWALYFTYTIDLEEDEESGLSL